MIKLQIIGNLGADAVMKEISGQPYISYSVCHTEKGRDGKDFSTWVNVMMRSKDQNPKILQYLTRGTQVYVEGNPSVGAYVDKSGGAKGSLSLWSFKVDLLGRPKEHKPEHGYVPPEVDESNDQPYDPAEVDKLPF